MEKEVTIKFSMIECFDLAQSLEEYLNGVKNRKIRTSINTPASQKRIKDLRKLFFNIAHK